MNPFDLPGPQFLLFYAALSGVVILLLRLLRHAGEAQPDTDTPLLRRLKHGLIGLRHAPGPAPKVDLSDAYLIAYLRGGPNEALRVASVSLVDRGLLTARDDGQLVTERSEAVDLVRRPIEKALLERFKVPAAASSIFADPTLAAACEDYERRLVGLGLLPGAAQKAANRRRLVVAVAVLWGVAVLKVAVALGRGRSNVLFLVILTLLAAWLAYRAARLARTARGEALLADLRTLFASLREAAIRPGGATQELALLAAVFGLAAIPMPLFPYVRTLYPKAASASGSNSSCGASCGASCGSSCGGGGCGGGCGGCGGD